MRFDKVTHRRVSFTGMVGGRFSDGPAHRKTGALRARRRKT